MKTTRLFLLVALVCFALLGGLLYLLGSSAPDPAPMRRTAAFPAACPPNPSVRNPPRPAEKSATARPRKLILTKAS